MREVKLMTCNPGHFHAALIHKEMVPGVSRKVFVYAPLGPDLVAHLGRLAAFNTRRDDPTSWDVEVFAGPDYLERMLRHQPGEVVVLAGHNRDKIDVIRAAVEAGLHVIADKPWVIEPEDLPKLDAVFRSAEPRERVAYDVMTERYEITTVLQRELIADPEVFGTLLPGTPEEPAVELTSAHALMKQVAGAPLRRPASFFDVREQGEGLTDVGTHLADLVPWLLFPNQAIDYQTDIQVFAGDRWPTTLTRDDFRTITGADDFPPALADAVSDGRLHYFCNNRVGYVLRGVHVWLTAVWEKELPAGDTHQAAVRGRLATVAVRQAEEAGARPELFVEPHPDADRAKVGEALRHRVETWQAVYPGVAVEDAGEHFRVVVPEVWRVGHEGHFAQVLRQFLRYVLRPGTLPAWEWPNMLAKYFVTTEGVRMARQAD